MRPPNKLMTVFSHVSALGIADFALPARVVRIFGTWIAHSAPAHASSRQTLYAAASPNFFFTPPPIHPPLHLQSATLLLCSLH